MRAGQTIAPATTRRRRSGAANSTKWSCDTCSAARELAPDDPETLRMLRPALTRQGRFEEAVGPWFAVAAATGDAEAAQADRGSARIARGRGNREEAAGPRSLGWREADLTDARAAQKTLRLARSAAADRAGSPPRAPAMHIPRRKSLVGRFEAEHNSAGNRYLQLRGLSAGRPMWQVRMELAQRLKQAGNYQRGDPATGGGADAFGRDDTAVLVELGENWQHLRQFAKALDYYQQAIAVAESRRCSSA